MGAVLIKFWEAFEVILGLKANDLIELVVGVDFLEKRLWAVYGLDVFFFLDSRPDLLVFSVALLQAQ